MPNKTTVPAPAKLAIVVPCYNESAVMGETMRRLTVMLHSMIADKQIDEDSAAWFVDDGSKDDTWQLIAAEAATNRHIKGIKLAHNKGHQHALLAGLENASGDILVSIDADLQDDVTVISEMVEQFYQGFDVVYGVRSRRDTDTAFKRMSAEFYYHILKKMGVEIVFNHADFRLMTRRVVNALMRYEEVNLFLRGIIPSIGYQWTTVEYARAERFAGESKYPLRKMLKLAVDGVTSFSSLPLRIIAALGLLIFVGSMILSGWVLWTKLISDAAIPGWASSVLPMYLLGGVQLLSLGVLGEYVAKIYMETKRRPRYIVEETID